MARQPGEPGSSGRTCPARRGRCPARSASAGRRAGCGTGQPGRPGPPGSARGDRKAVEQPRMASSGVRGGRRVETTQVAVQLPVPEAGPRTWCAQCAARVVLPTPAVPDSTTMTAAASRPRPARAAAGRSVSRLASSAPRPAKAATAGGAGQEPAPSAGPAPAQPPARADRAQGPAAGWPFPGRAAHGRGHAQLRDECAAQPLEGGQRIDLPATAIERRHELRPEALIPAGDRPPSAPAQAPARHARRPPAWPRTRPA